MQNRTPRKHVNKSGSIKAATRPSEVRAALKNIKERTRNVRETNRNLLRRFSRK